MLVWTPAFPQAIRSAERSPSLAETYEWLQSHLEQSVVIPFVGTRTIHVESVDHCQIVLTDTWNYSDTTKSPAAWRHLILIKDLDPEHHRLEPEEPLDTAIYWSLTIPTRTGRFTIVTCSAQDVKCEGFKALGGQIDLPFSEKNVATRTSKALRHAIFLCGGQRSPF